MSDEMMLILLGGLYLGLIVAMIAGLWKTFEKANQPGWGAIVPVYNIILMLRVAGKPLWWLLLMLIPVISLVPAVAVPFAIAKNFQKGLGYGLGLLVLPFVFYPILGFGSAEFDPDVPAF